MFNIIKLQHFLTHLTLIFFSIFFNALSDNYIYMYYENEFVPTNWENLSSDYNHCHNGNSQSPINITPSLNKIKNLKYFYSSLKPEQIVDNKGTALKLKQNNQNYILINDKKYNLVQFHFHNLSEHTLNSKKYDMELHLVHQNEDDTLAVIGILIKEGKSHSEIKKLLNYHPDKNIPENSTNINLGRLLPNNSNIYNYVGSLTTPPCTEGVNWLVMDKPIEASIDEITALRNLIKFNSRPIQNFKIAS
ncbi:MAG: carbonic anhydrase family protein [Sphingobacteriia bacterium]|nr:carbonic anhydrase family protein [Sphingobacteriia bacterium]